MPGKILGINIDGSSITAVKLEGGLRGYMITNCASVPIDTAGGLSEAIKALSEQADLKADTYFSTIPGEEVSYRNLRIPFRDPKKIKQTISFAIETMIPFPIEDLIVDFTIIEQAEQSDILAASVRRRYISEYLSLLKGHGIDPDILDIRGVPVTLWLLSLKEIPDNGLVLDIGSRSGTMVLYLKRQISLVRNFPFHDNVVSKNTPYAPSDKQEGDLEPEQIESLFSVFCTDIRNTLHAFGCQNNKSAIPGKAFITGTGSLYNNTEDLLKQFLEIPIERIDVTKDPKIHMDEDIARLWSPALMNSALALALRDNKKGPGFNFRQDEFEVEKKYFRFKKTIIKVGVLLLIILSLLIADLGVDYYSLKKRYKILGNQITEIFRQTLPDIKTIVDPVQQMRVKINEMQTSNLSLPGIGADHKVLDLLRDISMRIPESLDMKIMMMSIDPEIVQIKGVTDTFNTVDNVKKGLESSEYFSDVTISSANLGRSGNQVEFELKMQRASRKTLESK
ncbi:MAG TPA: pilus assembly protein PilM [Desulfatiglandales bacterium]|nr:pilus assembly protein PilM [Desulfatiglandales bacterium]